MKLKSIKTLLMIMLASIAVDVDAKLIKLEFDVFDIDGQPVNDVTVRIRSKNKMRFPYDDPGYKKMTCTTDKSGAASESFLYWGGDIFCYLEKSGFYSEDMGSFMLRSHYDRESNSTSILEDGRKLSVALKRRVNPQPLYTYDGHMNYWKFSKRDFKCGYDLQKNDWLPPKGNGEIADFYIQHQVVQTNEFTICNSAMTFDDGCGAYIVTRNERLSFPIVYEAETNRIYQLQFDGSHTWNDREKKVDSNRLVLAAGETMVIRSRVVKDESGNILKANYSKIYGPFAIAQRFDFAQSSYNPNVNDTNLEFDVEHNLTGQRWGGFHP